MTSTRPLCSGVKWPQCAVMSPASNKCGCPFNWPSLAVLLGYQCDMNGWLSLLYCGRGRQALLLIKSDAVSGLLG
jgi:hypothetical protein